MKVTQISLKERLERISNGYPSDPEFITSAIQSFANIQIATYLHEYPEELEILTKLISGSTKKEIARLTYKEVAIKIYELALLPRHSREISDNNILLASVPQTLDKLSLQEKDNLLFFNRKVLLPKNS